MTVTPLTGVLAAGPTINTNGVVEWGVKNIIPLVCW
jgi:hypothetical protein